MTTADMIKTGLEVLAIAAVIVGYFYQDKLVAFEQKIFGAIKGKRGNDDGRV